MRVGGVFSTSQGHCSVRYRYPMPAEALAPLAKPSDDDDSGILASHIYVPSTTHTPPRATPVYSRFVSLLRWLVVPHTADEPSRLEIVRITTRASPPQSILTWRRREVNGNA